MIKFKEIDHKCGTAIKYIVTLDESMNMQFRLIKSSCVTLASLVDHSS